MEKLSDLKSFKRLSSLIRPKSAGGALNLTRELHELVAEDISCLEQERDYDTMIELYEFIVDRLHILKSRTSGGVKGFISASLDYWQEMLDEKKPELVEKRKEKEDSRQLQVSDTLNRLTSSRPSIAVHRLNNRLKRRSRKMPLGVGEIIGLAHETDYRKSPSERTEQGLKIFSRVTVETRSPYGYEKKTTDDGIDCADQGSKRVSHLTLEMKPTVLKLQQPIEPFSVRPSQSAKQLLTKE